MFIIKFFFRLIIFVLTFLYSEINISGRIYNVATDEGIPDVNIYVNQSSYFAISKADGSFTLIYSGKNKEIVVEFNHIAYESVSKVYNKNQSSINIAMKEVMLQLDDVVVTSMRSSYLLRDVPVNTEVIGGKYIKESGAITVSELLEQRSGVTTDANVDGGSIFKLMGLDSRYILVLKDGQPVVGRFNNRVDLNHISLTGIEKIEITKGPGSVIYGTEAMGGVINIVSKRGKQISSFNSRFRTTTFSNNLRDITNSPMGNVFSFGNSLGSKNLYLNSNITIQTLNKGQEFEYINSDQINKYNFDSDLNWFSNNKNQEFKLSTSYFLQSDSGATKLSTGTLLFTNSTIINRMQFSAKYSFQFKNKAKIIQSLRQDYYSRNYSQNSEFDSFIEKDLTKEESLEYELVYINNYKYGSLNTGIEISNPIYMSDRIEGGKQKKTMNAIFFQQDWNFLESFDFVTGLRIDEYGDTIVFSPRIAYAYSLNENYKYRVSYGHGFRAPSFMETLINWNHVQFNYQVLGNPDLRSESSKGLTFGIEYFNQRTLKISSLIYHNRFENLIEDYVIEPGKLSYYNVSRASFTGFETLVKYLINSNTSVDYNLSIINNLNDQGKQIPNTVPLSMGLRIAHQLPMKGFESSINIKGVSRINSQEYDPVLGVYKSSKNIEPYAMIDIQMKYKINKKYSIVLGSKNIGDHTNKIFGPYIGRIGYVEFLTK